MLHVTGWVPEKQTLRWRFAYRKFIRDQQLWKWREGSRRKEREKVDYGTGWLKASADSMGCSEELSQIRVKVWAFTLLCHWWQAASERGHGLGWWIFFNWDHSKEDQQLSAHTTSSAVTEYVLYSQRGKYSIHYTAQNYSDLEQWALISCILLYRLSRILLN